MIGGRHLAASSASDSDGCLSRSDAISFSLSGQAVEIELPDHLELLLGREHRPLDVGLVGVRQPVRVGARRGDDGVLVETERGLARTGDGEQIGDRLDAPGVRDGVAATLGDRERDLLACGDLRQDARAVDSARAQLELGGPRPGERAAAEQGAAQVGAAAARAADDALRRALEGRPPRRQHARLAEHLRGRRVDLHVQLVARRPVERAPAIGADLRADAEVAQERERAPRRRRARQIEVHRELAVAAQVPRAGGVEQRRELGEAAAAPDRRDRRELVAQVVRERHARAPAAAACSRARATRTSRSRRRPRRGGRGRTGEPVPGAERAGGTGRARTAGERGELAVGHDLAARHGAQRARAVAVEAVVELELDVGEVVGLAGEERGEAARQRVSRPGCLARRRGPRQLRPDDAVVLQPQLADAPAGRRRSGGSAASQPML